MSNPGNSFIRTSGLPLSTMASNPMAAVTKVGVSRLKKEAGEGIARLSSGIEGLFGSGGRDRTYDQLINSQLLYR